MERARPLPSLLASAARWRAAARAFAQARRFPLLIAATLLFVAGSLFSFRQLGVSLHDLEPAPLLLQLALTPLSLLYGGVGLWLLARSAQAAIPLGKATIISGYASLAEVLPVPGGAIVRAGALVSAGAKAGHSSLLVVLTAVLWISLAALGCGLSLLGHGVPGAGLLTLAGAAGTGGVGGWLVRSAGWTTALQTVIHRLSGMVLISLRLHLAFLTLGITLPLADAMPFALANIAGSAASIAPAGLGISELLAALIAGSVSVAPGAAFLAVGIDRLICLAAAGVLVLARLHRGHNGQAPAMPASAE